MLQQRDSAAWHLANGAMRKALVRGYGNLLGNHVVVNEYPKSGGSWVAQMLSDALGLPFPRNRFPTWKSSILQCHDLGPVNCPRHVIVWRDGRDMAVSWYHHLVIGNQYAASHSLQETRNAIGISDAADVKANFNRALDYLLQRPRHPRFTWARFVDRWMGDPRAVHVHYEKLLADTPAELQKLVGSLSGGALNTDRLAEIVLRYSFKTQSGRKAGDESKSNYLRKGVAGDWRNYFDADAKELFHAKAGQQLIALGYEADDTWVKDQRND